MLFFLWGWCWFVFSVITVQPSLRNFTWDDLGSFIGCAEMNVNSWAISRCCKLKFPGIGDKWSMLDSTGNPWVLARSMQSVRWEKTGKAWCQRHSYEKLPGDSIVKQVRPGHHGCLPKATQYVIIFSPYTRGCYGKAELNRDVQNPLSTFIKTCHGGQGHLVCPISKGGHKLKIHFPGPFSVPLGRDLGLAISSQVSGGLAFCSSLLLAEFWG